MVKQALFFDLDGTLFSSETVICNALERTMDKVVSQGLYPKTKWTREQFLDIIGMPSPAAFKLLMPEADGSVHQRTGEMLLKEVTCEMETNRGSLYPGVKETLASLHGQGYKLYIASNGGEEYVRKALELHEVLQLFSNIFTAGKQRTVSKVHLVDYALHETGPNAIMIGDRASDIEAGKENGLPTIGCLFGFGSPEELGDADYLVARFPDLIRILSE